MVSNLEKLSDSLRQNYSGYDLKRIIRSRKQEIERALSTEGTFILSVPDGRQITLSKRSSATSSSGK
jgi:hypothetical protein